MMYRCVNVKVEPRLLLKRLRASFSHVVPILFNMWRDSLGLRPYANKNYATDEIHLKEEKWLQSDN